MKFVTYSDVYAVLVSAIMSLHFSLSRHDNYVVSASGSRTQNRKRHASSSGSSNASPTRHRRRRSSPTELTWVPVETTRSDLPQLKSSTSRSFDDSRVNPERKQNLSDSTVGEVFGPALPPAAKAEKQKPNSDSSDAGNQEAKNRQHQPGRDRENSVSASKVSKTDERRHSNHKQKIKRSRETSSTSCSPRRPSRSRSSSSSASRPAASESKKKSPARRKSSALVSRPRRSRSRSSSSKSSSEAKPRRKQVKRSSSSSSTSSSSTSSGSSYWSKRHSKKSTDIRSRKDQFKEQSDHRKNRQGLRRDSYPGPERRRQVTEDQKGLSFGSHRKSRSNSGGRLKKHVPVHQANSSGHKGERFERQSRKSVDRKEPGPAAKSDVKDKHLETRVKRLTNYSSSDDERTKTPQNKTGNAQKAATADRKAADRKKPTSGRRSDTAITVANSAKGADSDKTKTDDKPKETLEDMELFLKQLKANKQQMLKK